MGVEIVTGRRLIGLAAIVALLVLNFAEHTIELRP